MQIVYFDKIDSTQIYLKNNSSTIKAPLLIYTNNQTNGIGSRENKWLGEQGNLFFSFLVNKSYFAQDIPSHSLSIYIGFHIKIILAKLNSEVFLKWPNDLYIGSKKIGGLITYIKKDNIIIGCGINTKSSDNFKSLDIEINDKYFLEKLITKLNKKHKWSTIFNLYKKEFHKNYSFFVHHKNEKISLKKSILQNDGAIKINEEIIFNCR